MGFEDKDLNVLKATELRLGLPGTEQSDEQESSSSSSLSSSSSCVKNGNNKRSSEQMDVVAKAAPKAQVVGWPPVRSYRKNILQKNSEPEGSVTLVKVSMDGAPYLRKVDLCGYTNYCDLVKALERMFKCSIDQYSERQRYNGSEFAITYQDKDGDWMLAGDVPWDMFASSCKRLRIMKGSEAKGLSWDASR